MSIAEMLAEMLGCIFNVYSRNASMLASLLASIQASLLAGVACRLDAGSLLGLATLGPAGHSRGRSFLLPWLSGNVSCALHFLLASQIIR